MYFKKKKRILASCETYRFVVTFFVLSLYDFGISLTLFFIWGLLSLLFSGRDCAELVLIFFFETFGRLFQGNHLQLEISFSGSM